MNATELQAERRAKRFWVTLVVVLLGLQLVIGGISIHLATSDPTVAVIPDYHQASLNWDAAKAQRSAAERLGWKLRLSAAEIADENGFRAVELQVENATGEPVDELQVAGQLYRHARAGELTPIFLKSVGNGRYLTMAPMQASGLWQIEVTVDGASEPMRKSITITAAGE